MTAHYAELFQRNPNNPILTAEDWPYPANTVFNCAATLFNGETVLLARVEDMRGISHLTVARSRDGVSDWKIDPKPSIMPDPEKHPEELWGIEDPRITYIDDLQEFYIAYTAYSRGGPLVALAKTKDFKQFERLGPAMPPDDKDAALFPVPFAQRWAMLHRPSGPNPNQSAHIWISFSPDLKHWGDHRVVLRARDGGWWDASKIGLSPPPLKIPEGWLVFYHGVRKTGGGVIYRLGIALLDAEDPTKLLKRGDDWIFAPRTKYEREGDVDDVVFPGGWTLEGDQIRLYYGGADACIAVASASLSDLRQYIMRCPQQQRPNRWG